MANFFDQFDEQAPAAPAAAPQAGNFFDQFDEAGPAAPPVQPPAKVNTGADMVESFGSGIVRGAAETVMLPVTAGRMLDAGTTWLYDKGEAGVRDLLGMDPRSAETQALIDEARNRPSLDKALYGAQDAVRGGMDVVLHKPETTAGKFAGTIGEFVQPGIVANGIRKGLTEGIPAAARYAAPRIMGEAVVPGAVSETAGQMTEGTAAEPYARILGALAGNAAVVLPKAYNTVDNVVRRAIPNNTDWNKALDLQDNSFGVGLTGPEAITEAAGGSSALQDLQRVVEGSLAGKQRMAPFFQQRQQQVENTVAGPGGFLDAIGPQSANPTALGPAAADAAERALAAGPEGTRLTDAIMGVGPRTTDMAAGEVIQPALHKVFQGRDNMRAALGDADYQAAREAMPTIPVNDLPATSTMVEPGYTRLEPNADLPDQADMLPVSVPAKYETPAMTSNTGRDMIQVDARDALREIDALRATEKGGAAEVLSQARQLLYSKGGVDTSVAGLENARHGINAMIAEAKTAGKTHNVEVLERARDALDGALGTSPEFAQANRNFAAASEPLAPFNGTAAGKVIARDQFNTKFNMSPEEVPGALRSPSELQNFSKVAPPEARDAMQNNLATKLLDSATDAKGNVSVDKLRAALRDNEDILNQVPGLKEKFDSVIEAGAGLQSARTNSPLGKIASAKTTEGAGAALLPKEPLVGGAGETKDALARLLAQDPENATQLLRQEVAQRWSKASEDTLGGMNQSAGGKFHNAVAGDKEQRAVLDAVLSTLPSDKAAKMAPELLDVLSATRRRQNIGSTTAPNSSIIADLSVNSPGRRVADTLMSAGATFVSNSTDMARRFAYGKSVEGLADLFKDPRTVELIKQIADTPANHGFAEVLKRTGRQAGVAGRPR